MKLRLQYFAILAFLFLVPFVSVINAEEPDPINPGAKKAPILMGPSFGINRSLHTVNLTTYREENSINQVLCPKFESGSQTGFYVGWNMEFALTKTATDVTSSIVARLLYNSLPASMEIEGDAYPSKKSGTNIVDTTRTMYNDEVKYNLISFEAQYRLALFGSRLSFVIGPTFDFAIKKEHDLTMNLVGKPIEAQFNPVVGETYRNNYRTLVISGPEIPNATSLRIGIKAGMQYEIMLGNGTIICPNIQYNFGLTNLSSEQNWRVNAIQAGFDIRFPFRF